MITMQVTLTLADDVVSDLIAETTHEATGKTWTIEDTIAARLERATDLRVVGAQQPAE